MKSNNDRTNWFDDGVLDDDRVRRVIRGRRRNLHLREYNRGEGDWETFCRTVVLLKDFYKPQGGQVAFADSIERGEYLSKHHASFINVRCIITNAGHRNAVRAYLLSGNGDVVRGLPCQGRDLL